jgi:hypothetical protein
MKRLWELQQAPPVGTSPDRGAKASAIVRQGQGRNGMQTRDVVTAEGGQSMRSSGVGRNGHGAPSGRIGVCRSTQRDWRRSDFASGAPWCWSLRGCSRLTIISSYSDVSRRWRQPLNSGPRDGREPNVSSTATLSRMNCVRHLPTKWNRRGVAAPFGCTVTAGSLPPSSRTLLLCILPSYGHSLHHAAILWTRLHGVLEADRPDG